MMMDEGSEGVVKIAKGDPRIVFTIGPVTKPNREIAVKELLEGRSAAENLMLVVPTIQMPRTPSSFKRAMRPGIGGPSPKASLALGGPQDAKPVHLLYWGDQPRDVVGAEARWQTTEFGAWKLPSVLPDMTQANPKEQVKRAIDTPSPSPTAVIYFYCHHGVKMFLKIFDAVRKHFVSDLDWFVKAPQAVIAPED